MTELAIPYSITAPSGLRLVVGNSDTAKADPDWIGWLDPENGITGLLDGAEIQASILKRPRAAGVLMGPSLRGERSGTIQGVIDPNVSTTIVEQRAQKIRRVMAEIEKADGILRWTPSSDGIARQLRVRNVARPDVRGRRPKTFLLALSSRDPYVLGDTLQTRRASLPNLTGAWTGSFAIGGELPAWPVFRIYGPITNPRITNSAGNAIAIDIVLGANEYLLVIPERGVAYKGTTVIGDPTNLVTNPSFEVNTAGWVTTGNPGDNLAAGAVLTRVTSDADTGIACCDVTTTAASASQGASFRIDGTFTAGVTYRASIRVKGAFTGNALAAMLGDTSTDAGPLITVPRTVTWQTVTVAWTPTANRTRASLTVRDTVAAADFWLIDSAIWVSGALPAYFDGDIVGREWVGARHGSTSRTRILSGAALVPVPVRMDLTKWERLKEPTEDIHIGGTGTAHASATPGLEIEWRATWA